MSVDVKYPHIECRTGESPRLERVPRVRVAQVAMDYLEHGWSVEEMCRHHPYLKPSEAYAAMLYYADHTEEIDEEIRRESEETDDLLRNSTPSNFLRRMREEGRL